MNERPSPDNEPAPPEDPPPSPDPKLTPLDEEEHIKDGIEIKET